MTVALCLSVSSNCPVILYLHFKFNTKVGMMYLIKSDKLFFRDNYGFWKIKKLFLLSFFIIIAK